MFHVHLFEPYTCMVIEGFNALEMHLLLLLHGGLVGGCQVVYDTEPGHMCGCQVVYDTEPGHMCGCQVAYDTEPGHMWVLSGSV